MNQAFDGTAKPGAGPPSKDRRPCVLLVDDDVASILALRSALMADHQLIMARSGEEALNRVSERMPDLVLLDVEMPGMDGYEVFEQFKARSDMQDVPIVFITGHRDAAAEIRGLDMGAADFISKPFEPRIVRARVRTHLMLKQQADLLRRMAYWDSLTGVANRRHGEVKLLEAWRISQRSGRPLSVMLIDVDHFKRFNDCFGHATGDRCLTAVAEALNSVLMRGGDFLARYGGEEFLYVLPYTDIDGARAVADRALNAVRHLRVTQEDGQPAHPVTVSLGLACTAIDVVGGPEPLVALADQRLYVAKESGRDRCSGPWA